MIAQGLFLTENNLLVPHSEAFAQYHTLPSVSRVYDLGKPQK